VSAVYEGISF